MWRSAGTLLAEAASSWNWNCKSAEAAASASQNMSSCDCPEPALGTKTEKVPSPLLPPRSAQTVAQSSAGHCIWPGVRMSWFTSLCQVCASVKGVGAAWGKGNAKGMGVCEEDLLNEKPGSPVMLVQ